VTGSSQSAATTFRRAKRGLVLFAVLVLVGSAVLVATTVVFLVSGDVAGGANEREVLRLRAAGLSAVEAIAAKLGMQRNLMLEAGVPLADPTFELWDVDGETASAELLPVDSTGDLLVAECAKMPLRRASVDSLVASGAVDVILAGRIINLRDAGAPLASVDALLTPRGGADGLSAGELYGSIEALAGSLTSDQRLRRDLQLEASAADAGVGPAARPVREILTTFAFEPNVATDGSKRLAIDGEWTDDHRGEVDAALGTGTSAILEAEMKSGNATFASLFAAWRSRHSDPREWSLFLDRAALGEGPVEHRLDVLRATTEGLRSLPGITKEVAERIVREREGLPVESRRSIAWLAEREILSPDACAALAELATTRTFVWRVRVRATLVRKGEVEPRPGAVFEAVIDCSEERPRIALLRDLSALQQVATMMLSAPPQDEEIPGAEDAVFAGDIDAMNGDDVDDLEAEPPISELTSEPNADSGDDAAPASSAEPTGVPARRGIGRWRRSQ
jgi:hypothetical protein